MKRYRSSSTMSWKKATSVSHNLRTHRNSSSLVQSTASYDQYKTTVKSTHSSTVHDTSHGGTTMFAYAKETKRKRRSKPDMGFSNQRSCISDSLIRQRPSKP